MKAILSFALLSLGLTGCYTQLYTQGYAVRAAENYPGYARGPQTQADTALPGDTTGGASGMAYGDRAWSDSAERPPAVIVNNYYQEGPYYRGYREYEWTHPYVSLGFYSSGYRDYYGAYWWNDPWYSRNGYYGGRGRHHNGYNGYNDGSSHPSSGGGTSGPYKSDKRIFTPAPDRSGQPTKGRRSAEPAAAPAPKSSSEGNSGSSASESTSGSASGSDNGSSSSGSGNSSEKEKEKDNHPPVNKGRRR